MGMGSTSNQQHDHPSTDPWTLGDRLAKARNGARPHPLNQTELGERLGLTRATIGKYEAGRMPKDEEKRTVMAWAMATGWSYAWLRDGTGPWLADGTDGPGGGQANTPSGLPGRGFGWNAPQRRLVAVEAA